MANTVKVKILENGQRNLIVAVFLKSDGVTGELNKRTIIDPVADLGLKPSARLSLYKIMYNFAGFDSMVEFDCGVEDPSFNNFKWVLSEGANAKADFSRFGGVRDDSGINGTGKLQLTTAGFTSSTDFGSIIFELRMPS